MLTLTLLVAALPACRSEAQSRATSAAAKPKAGRMPEYRLTEPMIRTVSAVMREWDPTPDLADRMFVTADPGMPKAQFEALPDSQKVQIMLESKRRADEKYKEGERQIHSMVGVSLAEGVAAAEGIPALQAAYRKAGWSASQFVQAYNAYHVAMMVVLGEMFGGGVATGAGIKQDNVALFRAMSQAEALWTPMGLTEPTP